MVRIVHYSTSLSRSAGGLYTAVAGLASATAALGAEVAIVGGADEFFEADRAAWQGVDVRPHALKHGPYGFAFDAFSTIAALKPDIVHINGIWSAASIYGAVSALRGVPVVVSPHGMLDPWILSRSRLVKTVHSTLFERPMLARAHVHALSASEREAVLAYMPGIESRTFTLPNGISDTPVPASPTPRQGVLYLGRLHQKKQVLELMQAWSDLPAAIGGNLTIAGWGDAAYEAEVTRLAVAGVDFVGSLYGEAKSAAFSSARFFILPSLSEGLPMAVLEAIQHGCVPILTDQCNLPELFADDIALRMNTDFSDFPAVMTRALAMDDAEFAERSAAAQTYAQRYLWSNIACSMLSEYDRILGPRR
ncbi:poly(glycerol-phosphate) alpha-glucosyltransferase [Devosia sp. YR412]|uniref:glycosyltransferase n=1 Tax=Devosia sp. YR412 TaxID=1881030 RepID=UPI0008AC5ED3|nr:glycosyltransferase [Devosia sp. YR412]SEQ53680.1 poly(glycerol-phosphate) alpha-glucosyltransferase [Devosia sp. YR412]